MTSAGILRGRIRRVAAPSPVSVSVSVSSADREQFWPSRRVHTFDERCR